MPGRWPTAAIVLFWLGMTGWWFTREVVPTWTLEAAPGYVIDLTDEVGARTISWTAYDGEKRIGWGLSRVVRQPDRIYHFLTDFKFQDLTLLRHLEIRRMLSGYRVTGEGQLVELGVRVTVGEANRGKSKGPDVIMEIEGKVENDVLRLRPMFNGKEVDLIRLPSVSVKDKGSVLNPMHLLNRIPGLEEGRRFRLPLLDPLGGVVPGGNLSMPVLEGTVHADTLRWAGEEVPCLRIDYAKPGENKTASTWVRRSDGLVLQQEAEFHKSSLRLVRDVRN